MQLPFLLRQASIMSWRWKNASATNPPILIKKGSASYALSTSEPGRLRGRFSSPGPRAQTWSGVLATAGRLVFYGQPNGGFAAVDQRDGKALWQFPTNVFMKASPMTFTVGGHQYVAVAAGPNILC